MVIQKNLVGPGAGENLTIKAHSRGINRIVPTWEGMPLNSLRRPCGPTAFSSLVNPQGQQAELF